jgi:hypothetical protein
MVHGAMAADSAVEAFDSMFDSRCPSVLLLICGFCGYCMASMMHDGKGSLILTECALDDGKA